MIMSKPCPSITYGGMLVIRVLLVMDLIKDNVRTVAFFLSISIAVSISVLD